MVPITLVQRLDAHIATIFQIIQPYMHKSTYEAEEWINKRVAQYTKLKIRAVHQLLDVFDLRLLAPPTPTIDLTTLKDVVSCLWANIDTILQMRGTEPESVPIELEEDIALDALLKTFD